MLLLCTNKCWCDQSSLFLWISGNRLSRRAIKQEYLRVFLQLFSCEDIVLRRTAIVQIVISLFQLSGDGTSNNEWLQWKRDYMVIVQITPNISICLHSLRHGMAQKADDGFQKKHEIPEKWWVGQRHLHKHSHIHTSRGAHHTFFSLTEWESFSGLLSALGGTHISHRGAEKESDPPYPHCPEGISTVCPSKAHCTTAIRWWHRVATELEWRTNPFSGVCLWVKMHCMFKVYRPMFIHHFFWN